jgi:hypothetical protein
LLGKTCRYQSLASFWMSPQMASDILRMGLQI